MPKADSDLERTAGREYLTCEPMDPQAVGRRPRATQDIGDASVTAGS